MNRAWMAVAGLVALGAAALTLDLAQPFWYAGPAYVAGATPLSPAKCRAWERRAEKGAALGLPASLEAFEGFSRLQGACHPQDQERGRAMIEASIAKGAGAFLMMEYVLALRRVGDKARAAGELPIVAELMYPNARHRWVPQSPIWRPLLRDAWNEIVLMETSSDLTAMRMRLDHILGRPPLRPKTEEWVIWMLLSRMRTADYPEAAFQSYLASRAGRRGTDNGDNNLSIAANCGHAEAIRLRARLVLSGELAPSEAWDVVPNLIWLNSRTSADGALLAEAIARAPPSAPIDEAAIIKRRDERISESCGPRFERTLGRAG